MAGAQRALRCSRVTKPKQAPSAPTPIPTLPPSRGRALSKSEWLTLEAFPLTGGNGGRAAGAALLASDETEAGTFGAHPHPGLPPSRGKEQAERHRLDGVAYSSSVAVRFERLINQPTPRRSAMPTRARLRLLYLDTPVPRARWLTGTLRTRQPARCISAGR